MSKTTPWVFVDCEARGTSAVHGVLAEFGTVQYDTRDTFHGRLFDAMQTRATPRSASAAIAHWPGYIGCRLAPSKSGL